MIGDQPSGQDLVDALRAAAAKRRVTLKGFVAPLVTSSADNFLGQLGRASRPTQLTIDRVRALIEGKPIPPARPSPIKGRSLGGGGVNRITDGDVRLRADEIEGKRLLAEAAAAARRPGETLQDAQKRVGGAP